MVVLTKDPLGEHPWQNQKEGLRKKKKKKKKGFCSKSGRVAPPKKNKGKEGGLKGELERVGTDPATPSFSLFFSSRTEGEQWDILRGS